MAADDNKEASLTVRVPADVLRRAKRRAAKRDETISQVVRRLLRAYGDAAPAQTDLEDFIAPKGRTQTKPKLAPKAKPRPHR